MKIISVLFAICILTASSQGQVTGACSNEEQRLTAVDKVLASIGCDNYACSKFTS